MEAADISVTIGMMDASQYRIKQYEK